MPATQFRMRFAAFVAVSTAGLALTTGAQAASASIRPPGPCGPVVTQTIPVGTGPAGVAVSAATGKIYVTNSSPGLYSNNGGTVSVIDGGNDTVLGTITVGGDPYGVAVSPVTGDI
jgi:YVTN family beta-propeller protein